MRHLIAVFMAVALAGAAQAQVDELPSTADAQTLDCLQRGTGAPRFPAVDLQARSSGTVRVSLRFTSADRPPEMTVLFRAASDAMVDAVERHVDDYRLPCLNGPAVTAVQEFSFRARVTAPITWTPLRPTRDRDDPEARAHCLRTPALKPEFNGGRLYRDVANLFVDMTFTTPDAPPTVTVAYSNAGAHQEAAVRDYVAQYRMPCLGSNARPATLRQHFQFRPPGVAKRVFKDAIALPDFLSNMKGIREQRVSFDFSSMNCPFQVAWTLGQPKLNNLVGQVGPPDANRTEFLTWLRGLEMDMQESRFEQLVGQTVIVNVACGTLDLGD